MVVSFTCRFLVTERFILFVSRIRKLILKFIQRKTKLVYGHDLGKF